MLKAQSLVSDGGLSDLSYKHILISKLVNAHFKYVQFIYVNDT